MWHKWLHLGNDGVFQRHRGNCNALFQGMVLVGDYENGKIYMLDRNNYTDDGQTIRRVRRAPHLITDMQRQYFDEFQIQFQPGVGTTGLSTQVYTANNIYIGSVYLLGANGTLTIPSNGIYILADKISVDPQTTTNPQAMLRWSNDGGSTWSNEYWVSIGQLGKYKNRAIWRRLGMARDRIYEVAVTDPVNMVIVSANLKSSAGEN